MTKIRLSRMEIRNFKRVHELDLKFDGKDGCITGANASGKTTIYKAYYWCLTGKTLEPNEVIQTLDENNEVVHKIETSVKLFLVIDNSYEVRIERKLVEDWKALGMPNEQLKGTTQQRFFNEVPLTVAEFNTKLNSIYNLDKWLLLSNVNTFMGLKTEERRKILMSAVGGVDERELMEPYPELTKAIFLEKKTVEEVQIQNLATKKRANDELKTIPSQISAQDRLRVDVNFAEQEERKKVLTAAISDIDKQLEGTTEELEEAKELHNKEKEVLAKMFSMESAFLENKKKTIAQKEAEISKVKKELREAQEDLDMLTKEIESKATKLEKLMEDFEGKKKHWLALNAEEFSYDSIDVCPTCGRKFSAEEVEEKKKSAIKAFNKEKSQRLEQLQEEASLLNQQIVVLKGVINEDNKIIKPTKENLVRAKQTALSGLLSEATEAEFQKIDDNPDYNNLKSEYNIIQAKRGKPIDASVVELREKKKSLMEELQQVNGALAGRQVNEKIAEEKKRLEARAVELSQIVANCDNLLYQIKCFRNQQVGAIEEKVNALFLMARWKFFKMNTSNDDYMEVCICTHNGVDWGSTNTADKINLGCDIIYGLSNAFELSGILFVDNKETVANLLMDKNVQLITLEHVPNAPLELNIINN